VTRSAAVPRARRSRLLLPLLLSAIARAAEENPIPGKPGAHRAELEGLRCRLEIPAGFDPAREGSLVVALHGAGSNDDEYASWFEPLVADGFAVCSPQSRNVAWTRPDVEIVKRLVLRLTKALNVGPGRLHGAGFSNGGAHLGDVVFEPRLRFATACWMGSGGTGGRVPRRARKEMPAIAVLSPGGEVSGRYTGGFETAALVAAVERAVSRR